MTVQSISTAPDKDAEYVLRHLEEAAQHEANAKRHTEDAAGERERALAKRIGAGTRLIEVKSSLRLKEISRRERPGHAFVAWYEASGLKRSTVYDHLRLAGYTEEKREKVRQKIAKRKRKVYVRQKRAASKPVTHAEAVGPLVLALIEINKQIKLDPASQVVARLRRDFDRGEGLDIGFITSLTTLRNWLDQVIAGAKPFVVHCGKQEKTS